MSGQALERLDEFALFVGGDWLSGSCGIGTEGKQAVPVADLVHLGGEFRIER